MLIKKYFKTIQLIAVSLLIAQGSALCAANQDDFLFTVKDFSLMPKAKKMKRGKTGKTGARGATGPCGLTGATGACGPVHLIAPYNLFVDGATTQNPLTADGTIAKPYSTIQAAINTISSAMSDTSFEQGVSIIIASGVYDENLVINGDNKRISLIGLGTVILGNVNPGDITWTMTDANNNRMSGIRSSLSIGTLYSLDKADSTIFGQTIASGPSFYVNGTITVTNDSTTPGHGAVDLVVNACTKVLTFPSSNDFVFLHFTNSDIQGTITGNGNTVLLQAVGTHFNQLVQVGSYHTISECTFDAGMTSLTSSGFAYYGIFSDSTAPGFTNCIFYGTFTGTQQPGGSHMRLDVFTNGFMKTISRATLNDATKEIIGDLTP